MNDKRREFATNTAFATRETRDENPYRRICFNGSASARFQVIRNVVLPTGRTILVPQGDFATLDAAIVARDAMPEEE